MSEALAQAYASAPEDEIILDALEFYHPNWAVPVRIVNAHSEVRAFLEASAPRNALQEVVFRPVNFSIQLSQESESNRIPDLSITVGNVGLILTEYLEKLASSPVRIELICRRYLSSDLTAPAINPPKIFNVNTASANLQNVTFRASINLLSNSKFPKIEYTAKDFRQLVSR
jgi:hypothetical protein